MNNAPMKGNTTHALSPNDNDDMRRWSLCMYHYGLCSCILILVYLGPSCTPWFSRAPVAPYDSHVALFRSMILQTTLYGSITIFAVALRPAPIGVKMWLSLPDGRLI